MMAMVGYESLTNPKGIGKTGFVSEDENLHSIRNLNEAGIINMDGVIVGGLDDDTESIARELDSRSEAGGVGEVTCATASAILWDSLEDRCD